MHERFRIGRLTQILGIKDLVGTVKIIIYQDYAYNYFMLVSLKKTILCYLYLIIVLYIMKM